MATEISTLDPRLTPAPMAEVAELLHRLFVSLPMPAGPDEEIAVTNYVLALKGMPAWAISQAIEAFLQCRVPGQSAMWAPRPPMLAAAARREMQAVYDDIDRSARRSAIRNQIRERAEIEARQVKTPEQKARAIEIMRGFRQRMQSEPITTTPRNEWFVERTRDPFHATRQRVEQKNSGENAGLSEEGAAI